MKELTLSVGGNQIPLPQGVASLNGIGTQSFITLGINVLIVAAIILSLFFLVWGGIDIIMANGEKEKVVKARLKLTYAVAGLLVVFLSFLIVGTIGSLFGVKLLAPTG